MDFPQYYYLKDLRKAVKLADTETYFCFQIKKDTNGDEELSYCKCQIEKDISIEVVVQRLKDIGFEESTEKKYKQIAFEYYQKNKEYSVLAKGTLFKDYNYLEETRNEKD